MASTSTHGILDSVIYLLSYGADPMTLDEDGNSVLEIMKRKPVLDQLVKQIESGMWGRFELDEARVLGHAPDSVR